MKRLLDDDMDRMTDAESERIWHDLEMAALKPPRTIAEIVRPWALGATAAATLVLIARQSERSELKWQGAKGSVVEETARFTSPPTAGKDAPRPVRSEEGLVALPHIDGPSGSDSRANQTLKAMTSAAKMPQLPSLVPTVRKAPPGEAVTSLAEINVVGKSSRLTRSSSSTKVLIGKQDLESLPVDTYADAIARNAGAVQNGGELHYRGGRAGEVAYMIDGLRLVDPLAAGPSVGTPPRVDGPSASGMTSTGGTDPVNGEAFDATFFESAGTNPFIDASEDSLATFAMDVDNASFTVTRAYLERGVLPSPDAVRVEEFVNAIRHDYAPPLSTTVSMWNGNAGLARDDFSIHLAAAPSPFGNGLTLLRVGLKAREVAVADRKSCTLTFVIDVSGSMNLESRLVLVKRALKLLLDQMDHQDEVAIVVYGSTARVMLPHTSLARRAHLERAIDSLVPEGSTNVEAGLREGYRLADAALKPGRVNRVILCSDGVANNGLTEADDVLNVIRADARRGIELTTVGFGMDNYNDVLMEKLANHGDGSYWYVDDIDEAHRVFVESLTGTLQTVARQAKAQIEFSPELVERYRLIGYENRDVADRNFRNDAIDAGEVGAGHEVTALFELKLRPVEARSSVTAPEPRNPLATVRIRYEDVESGKFREVSKSVLASMVLSVEDPLPADLKLDAAVVEFAEILRGSYWSKGNTLTQVLPVAREAVLFLGETPERRELITMMETADRIWPAERRQGWRDDE